MDDELGKGIKTQCGRYNATSQNQPFPQRIIYERHDPQQSKEGRGAGEKRQNDKEKRARNRTVIEGVR